MEELGAKANEPNTSRLLLSGTPPLMPLRLGRATSACALVRPGRGRYLITVITCPPTLKCICTCCLLVSASAAAGAASADQAMCSVVFALLAPTSGTNWAFDTYACCSQGLGLLPSSYPQPSSRLAQKQNQLPDASERSQERGRRAERCQLSDIPEMKGRKKKENTVTHLD